MITTVLLDLDDTILDFHGSLTVEYQEKYLQVL